MLKDSGCIKQCPDADFKEYNVFEGIGKFLIFFYGKIFVNKVKYLKSRKVTKTKSYSIYFLIKLNELKKLVWRSSLSAKIYGILKRGNNNETITHI